MFRSPNCTLIYLFNYPLDESGNLAAMCIQQQRTLVIIWKLHNDLHYCDVIMGAIESRINSLKIVYSTVYSSADQRKHQNSASLAFVRGIHRGPVNSPHKWPVTRKMFPIDDVIMISFPSSTRTHCYIPRMLALTYCVIIKKYWWQLQSTWVLDRADLFVENIHEITQSLFPFIRFQMPLLAQLTNTLK